jgi:uncharacterized protein YjbI with pentapeptide repeats
LRESRMCGTSQNRVDFTSTNFTAADLHKFCAEYVLFYETNLTRADLISSTLEDVQFTNGNTNCFAF